MRSYVHFKTYQKVISMFLVVCFLTIPLTFLTFPKKAEAVCVPFTLPLIPTPTSVPTQRDALNPSEQADQALFGTNWFKNCVLDGLATLIAKTIIKALTKSIVTWINSGFKGNPSFVQNPGKFFGGIADKVAGQEIERIAPFLCEPFKANIQLALAGSMTTSANDEVSCTLTDVQNNIGYAANNSSVGVSASWDNWYDMTQNPQNNPYGAMMVAQSQMTTSIETSQGKYQQQLDWGKGFLSFEDCSADIYGNNAEEGTYMNPYDMSDTNVYDQSNQPVYGVQAGDQGCVTKTPGAVIESQLENTLGSDLRGLEIAQSIDQIVAALVGQLVSQAMGGLGGLMGASSGSSSGGGGGGSNYQNSLGGISNGTTRLPNVPLGGSCIPSTQNAQVGETVTWEAYVPDISGEINYEWYGDENLAGDFPYAMKEYSTGGTKTASVVISTFGTNPQSVQIDCTPNVEVASTTNYLNHAPDISIPIISCYPSPETVSLSAHTPVTWQVTIYGGKPPFSFTWGGSEGLSGTNQTTVKTYTLPGTKNAMLDLYSGDGNVYSKVCGSTVTVTP